MNLRDFALRLIINMIALVIAANLINGINVNEEFGALLVVALILGIVNALVKPILTLMTCPAVILTLGLFLLVINAFVLQITAWLSGGRMDVDGFGAAFLGGIVMSITNMVLEGITGANKKNKSSGARKRR